MVGKQKMDSCFLSKSYITDYSIPELKAYLSFFWKEDQEKMEIHIGHYYNHWGCWEGGTEEDNNKNVHIHLCSGA